MAEISKYAPIRAQTSEESLAISNIPIPWDVDNDAGDFFVVAIDDSGDIIEGVSNAYLSYDGENRTLSIAQLFDTNYCVYIFRNEEAANLFSIKSDGNANIASIIAQFEKDNRVLEQLQVLSGRTLRTCDPIKTLPPKEKLIGKVLAFGEDGNPDLSLSKEDVEGAYLARDEAKELKNETETLKNETSELKSDAESYKNYAIDAASKAVAAQGKAEVAQVAAEKAKAETGNLKSGVEATVSEFNSTVNSKVQEVEGAAQSGITAVNSAKTSALGGITASKTSAISEVDAAKTEAVGEIATIKSEVETAGENAVSEVNAAKAEAKTEIAADLANAKNEIDAWSDQGERFAKNEADISALAIDKANRGALWFNKAKLTTATNNATTLPLTLCLTYDCDDWSPCVGKSFGSGVAFFNTEIVNWSNGMHYGFNFGVYSASGNANEIHLATRVANNVANSVANNYISFNKATGKHTLCVSLSEVADFAVRFYQDGAFLGVRTNKSSVMADEIGGSSAGVHIATIANYATTGGQTAIPNLKLSRLKIFNCVLPATKADDTDGIGYTVEDYHNGIDEPPTMQDGGATYRTLLSLQDYVFNGEVLDASGSGNHASITVSDGGSVKGTNDNAVETLFQKIATRISNATVE